MVKGAILLGIILGLQLTACALNPPAVPRYFEGSSKIFKVSDNGTVKVNASNQKDESTHWVFVFCAHWSGCYMRCQGPKIVCRSIAKKSGLKVSHIITTKK